jgi:hypothetical protein
LAAIFQAPGFAIASAQAIPNWELDIGEARLKEKLRPGYEPKAAF